MYPGRKNTPPQNVSTWMCHLRLSGTAHIRAPISYTHHDLGANYWLLNKECHFFQLLTLFWAISFIIIFHTSVIMLSSTSHHEASFSPWWCSRLPFHLHVWENVPLHVQSPWQTILKGKAFFIFHSKQFCVFPCASGHKIDGAWCKRMAGSLTQQGESGILNQAWAPLWGHLHSALFRVRYSNSIAWEGAGGVPPKHQAMLQTPALGVPTIQLSSDTVYPETTWDPLDTGHGCVCSVVSDSLWPHGL